MSRLRRRRRWTTTTSSPRSSSASPRASSVCRRWRRLASDPGFCRRFRAHHRRRNPPLLGCFVEDIDGIRFEPILEAPNRVPKARFACPIHAGDPLGCRHGLVFFLHNEDQLLVWDPITGEQHRVDVPSRFDEDDSVGGAVLRSAAGHFQVVFVGNSETEHTRAVASVYSSETGEWGDLVSTPLPPKAPMSYRSTSICMNKPCVLIEGSCYWSLAHGPGILAFDLDIQSLSVIHLPVDVSDLAHYDFSVVRAEGGRLGFFVVPGFNAQLWKWNRDCDGAASWVLERSIELDKLLSLNPDDERERPIVAGFAEDNNVVLLWSFVGVFTLQLESLHSKKLFRVKRWFCCLPFEGVYTAESDRFIDFLLLSMRILVLDVMEPNFCTIHNMICPVLSECIDWAGIEGSGLRWLRCRSGLLAVRSPSILYAVHGACDVLHKGIDLQMWCDLGGINMSWSTVTLERLVL